MFLVTSGTCHSESMPSTAWSKGGIPDKANLKAEIGLSNYYQTKSQMTICILVSAVKNRVYKRLIPFKVKRSKV